MELLVPGLILVALMVYASTRIKKSAARAYEREIVDATEFSIVKPEGMICPVEEGSPFAFRALSREFGDSPAENVRKLTADVFVMKGTDIERAADEIRASAISVIDDRAAGDGRMLETEEPVDGARVRGFYQLSPRNGDVFRLRLHALDETNDETQRKVTELLESFSLK